MPDAHARRRLLAAVDWSRMAEPQSDGYDTGVVLRLAPLPPREQRAPEPGSVWFDVAPVYRGLPDFENDFARYRDAPASHPNVPRAVALVEQWPLGAAQARKLIAVLHAALDPEVEDDTDTGSSSISSASHSYEHAAGTLWATVHSPVGLAEAIVHEMAHHKLRACGVGFTSATAIVANLPDERYPSPLLAGRARPMPALLHAHYALLHMIALEIAVLTGQASPAAPLLRALLRRHRQLIVEGDETLRRHLIVDHYGARFLPALRRWQHELLCNAEVHI